MSHRNLPIDRWRYLVDVGIWPKRATFDPIDMTVALILSFAGAITLIGSTYAAPVLGIVGVLSFAFHRQVALRFLAAGLISALPIAIFTWLERT
jgi:hypothetical protein